MVKQQAGRMKAKEQAVQLLEQSDKLSGDLAKALNEMATPYQMTAAERAVFQAGGGVPAPGAEGGSGIQIEIVGDVGGNPPPGVARDPLGAKDRNSLPPELKAFATAAETHFRNLEFEEAERSYLKILEDEPRNIHSLCNVAVVQLRQNKLKEAEIHIKKAQAYDYQNDFSHYLLGVVHLRQGRYQESLDSVHEGLKIKPDNAEGYLALGFIYIQMKKYAEAEKAFAQAVKLNPNSADAHYNLAVLYTLSETPNLNLAKVHYRKALENGAAPDSRLGKLLEM
jgi:tetratricopeptide (TPR) repeat protein